MSCSERQGACLAEVAGSANRIVLAHLECIARTLHTPRVLPGTKVSDMHQAVQHGNSDSDDDDTAPSCSARTEPADGEDVALLE